MFERKKLEEAKYFYKAMIKEREDREFFCYNLSAFLSASRSVLQYSLEEAKTKKDGKKWYDSHMTNNPIFNFFKDKRDINIHTEPTNPIKNVSLGFRGTIYLSSSLKITHRDRDGNIIRERIVKEPKKTRKRLRKKIEKRFIYRFSDWNGSEDIKTLGKIYLNDLEKLINDGVKKSFLTGL